jgi:hypothetical protein
VSRERGTSGEVTDGDDVVVAAEIGLPPPEHPEITQGRAANATNEALSTVRQRDTVLIPPKLINHCCPGGFATELRCPLYARKRLRTD